MISVVMPAYNAEQFIAEAIESILNQTYQEFELIVVDDGSTDGTLNIINEYVKKDPRLTLIHNEHGGACKARNDAIKIAKYEWVAPMDADDVAMPNRLERLMQAALADPEVVVWGSYMHQINVEGKIIGQIQIGPTTREQFYALDRTRSVIMVVNPTAMFKKDIALKVGGYDERLPAAQDVELWDRMAAYGPILVIPEPLLKYRLHGSSISAKRFFDQRMLHEFVLARYRAHQEEQEMTLPDFIVSYKSQPPLKRFFRNMHQRGRHYYRNSGVYLSQKQYPQAVFSLTMSLIFSPQFSLSRIRNRFFPRRYV